MNKAVITIVIIAVIGLGGYFLFKESYQSSPTPQTSDQQPVSPPPTSEPPNQQPSPDQKSVAEPNVVTYTDAGYSPNTLSVKVGAAVVFKNNSSQSMWTASAAHPTHRIYPTTGGCLGSTFDACQNIQPGNSWSFTFDIAGTWKYHNHLNPSDTGTVVVE